LPLERRWRRARADRVEGKAIGRAVGLAGAMDVDIASAPVRQDLADPIVRSRGPTVGVVLPGPNESETRETRRERIGAEFQLRLDPRRLGLALDGLVELDDTVPGSDELARPSAGSRQCTRLHASRGRGKRPGRRMS